MIWMTLLLLHTVQAFNQPRVQPEEDEPESNATCKPKCGESGEGGSMVWIRIEGTNAVEAMQEIERLMQSRFDEDQI